MPNKRVVINMLLPVKLLFLCSSILNLSMQTLSMTHSFLAKVH